MSLGNLPKLFPYCCIIALCCVPRFISVLDAINTIYNNNNNNIYVISDPVTRRMIPSSCPKKYTWNPLWSLVGQGLLSVETSRSHPDTLHLVGLLWTDDQLNAESSTWQHATLSRDRQSFTLRDSNPQSQQAKGRKPTPQTAGHLNLLRNN
jgi:hypothetical protein